MDTSPLYQPGLTVALALALGMAAQVLAQHLRLPGIVLLLGAGVLFGPDGLGVIFPGALGPALNVLTGLAVAVILFEGGMNLKFGRMKTSQRSIRQLIVLGGAITTIGGALAAHAILGWSWETSALFGTLVMVTGPTVINPLLKRLKVKHSVATVLSAEGLLLDAIGAVVATVALEAALNPAHGSPLLWAWDVVARLGFGALTGGLAALVLINLFRLPHLIPEGIQNVFTLSVVLALFQGSNAIMPESGIAAVTMAGIIVGNLSTRGLRNLIEFKEELTVLLIGMLFVLLAADVRLEQVMGLGLPGLWVVLALLFLVRPVAVLAGTWSSRLNWKERVFVGWIGPRGIVAAAVASFFSASLTEKGLPGGHELRALVFLVIAVSVVLAGLTGGLAAGVLGLRRPSQLGWVMLGAHELARAVAVLFRQAGQEMVLIDSNAQHCQAAQEENHRIIYGNGLESTTLLRAAIDSRRGALALTANDEVNYLFTQKVREETREISLYSALKTNTVSLTVKMLRQAGADALFAGTTDVETWNLRFIRGQVFTQVWKRTGDSPTGGQAGGLIKAYPGTGLLIVALKRNEDLRPIGDSLQFKPGDEITCFVLESESNAVQQFLQQAGWSLLPEHPA
ncbi:MAG: cation:proton antiporter [Deltaproteobacteria bacterium]|nr:cation:proton antiporter [Deltaproteobacteria bacterium]